MFHFTAYFKKLCMHLEIHDCIERISFRKKNLKNPSRGYKWFLGVIKKNKMASMYFSNIDLKVCSQCIGNGKLPIYRLLSKCKYAPNDTFSS